MCFRDNLKEELEFQGIKVKELAERTQISRRTLDQYFTTTAKIPSVINGYKIAQALNVTVEYLVTGKKELKNKELDEMSKELLAFSNELKSTIDLRVLEIIRKH